MLFLGFHWKGISFSIPLFVVYMCLYSWIVFLIGNRLMNLVFSSTQPFSFFCLESLVHLHSVLLLISKSLLWPFCYLFSGVLLLLSFLLSSFSEGSFFWWYDLVSSFLFFCVFIVLFFVWDHREACKYHLLNHYLNPIST